jgi:hypothetical protein
MRFSRSFLEGTRWAHRGIQLLKYVGDITWDHLTLLKLRG